MTTLTPDGKQALDDLVVCAHPNTPGIWMLNVVLRFTIGPSSTTEGYTWLCVWCNKS